MSQPRQAPPAARPAGLLLAAGVLVLTAGCTSGADRDPSPVDYGTPLAEVDTGALTAARTDFCALVPDAAVERALGGPAVQESSYRSGDRVKVTSDVKDVAHEFSCTWQSADKVAARGWVFAPPVSPARARSLVAGVRRARGCRVLDDAPALGHPTIATSCETQGRTTITVRGLLGDAWLSCSLAWPDETSRSIPADDRWDRAGRWCAAVVLTVAPE